MIKLRNYQEQISNSASDMLRQYGVAYLSMECRTGKTLTALACAQKFGAVNVLFVSKKKALPSVDSDYNLLRPNFKITLTTHDSVHKCTDKYDLVIVDEAHSIGAFPRPSKRAKELRPICKNAVVLLMSGTPSPESYSQLYHQFWICPRGPWRQYATFYKWANIFVNKRERMINGYSVTDYSGARKDLIDRDTKHLFLSYSQEEAGFKCEIQDNILVVPTPPKIRNLINELRRDKVTYINLDTAVLGDTPVKLMGKLHQLSSGTVIAESGEHLIVDTFKADFVKSYFKGQKIAIFYVYQTEAELLKKVFPNWTDSPEVFQQSDDRVFIGQVRSAREGVRLDTAQALIFFNLEYSYLSYEQGRNRLSSKERETTAQIYFVCSDCGLEGDILDAVHDKKDFTWSYYKNKHGK